MACSSCRSKGGGPCGSKSTYLRNSRVRATTLYNITKDLEQKVEYRQLITQIDEMISNSKTECPSQEEITLIQNYIDSEYAKRIR
jgi:hypothetical protein